MELKDEGSTVSDSELDSVIEINLLSENKHNSENDINNYIPTSPVLYVIRKEYKQEIYTLPCTKLDVKAECYVSNAIINIEGRWINKTYNQLSCIFAVPTPRCSKIINVTIRRIYEF